MRPVAAIGVMLALALAGCGQPASVDRSDTANRLGASDEAIAADNSAATAPDLTLTPEQQMHLDLVDMAALRRDIAAHAGDTRQLARDADLTVVDRDGDGALSLVEWCAYAAKFTGDGKPAAGADDDAVARAARIFFRFDLNNDKRMQPDEFILAQTALGSAGD